ALLWPRLRDADEAAELAFDSAAPEGPARGMYAASLRGLEQPLAVEPVPTATALAHAGSPPPPRAEPRAPAPRPPLGPPRATRAPRAASASNAVPAATGRVPKRD